MIRNTDADWEGIAAEPYYGVFSHVEYFKRNLTPERLTAFWDSGCADIAWQLDLLRQHYGPFDPKSAIDFGCGVGRLLRAIADQVDVAYGIDVAEGMREEARKNVPGNARVVASIDDIPEGQVDWINSTIVFQHIHPANGIPLFQQLLDRLAPGGGMTVHFTTFKDSSATTPQALGVEYFSWYGESMKTLIENPPGSGTMMMYDYDLNQIMAMLHRADVNRFTIQHSDHGGHHGAFLIGRKQH